MHEKLLLISSVALLSGSLNHPLFIAPSIAEPTAAASSQWRILSIGQPEHTVAPKLTSLEQNVLLRRQVRLQTLTEPTSIPETKPFPPAIHPAIDKPDITIEHRLLANEVLRRLPEQCQGTLRNFYVRYQGMEGRGLGGKSTIILNGQVPLNEFRALFVHELGHVVDLGCLQGNIEHDETAFYDNDEPMYGNDPSLEFYRISWLNSHTQRQGATAADFVSGYASWDVFEDFAESFAYYLLHRDEFAKRTQDNPALAAKYAWFQTHLPNVSLPAVSQHDWNGQVPWDVTKLAYDWHSNQELVYQN